MTIVYLDMDGVLADFDRRKMEAFGNLLEDVPADISWKMIKDHDPDWYANLLPMPDARHLVDGLRSIANLKVAVLTAVPQIGRNMDAKPQKKYWLGKYFPELLDDFNIGPYARHKHYHCRPGDILIDDVERNIKQWHEAGGLGILHTDAITSIRIVRDYISSIAEIASLHQEAK